MSARRTSAVLAAVATVVVASLVSPALAGPHAGMLLYPDVSSESIVFRYANDLWLVPREGGTALPLTGTDGRESMAKFSPDGSTVAFSGSYDGVYDIYTMSVEGGVPSRVTHHPIAETVNGWTQDGRIIFSAWGAFGENPQAIEIFTVSPEGGLPERIPVPYGTNGAVSDDGVWLAYTPSSSDHATWKRYRGGTQSDIWLFNLRTYESRRITDWEGADSHPMWMGDRIYFVSDRGQAHRRNVWCHDLATGEQRQVTRYRDYDVKWPSIGPGPGGDGEIVYQLGPELRLLDLATETSSVVNVTIPGDRLTMRARDIDVSGFIDDGDISPAGERAVVSARGDIWTLPAEHGMPRNLTRTSGVAERDPAWSPDGRWIAYFSDETGEYELYVVQSDGKEEPRRLSSLRGGFPSDPLWSPDSKWIVYNVSPNVIRIADVEGGTDRRIHERTSRAQPGLSWSHDSSWLAFHDDNADTELTSIWLYNIAERDLHEVTSGMFSDTWPTFDREGKYLFLASQRDFSSPISTDYAYERVFTETDHLYVVPLSAETESPFAPEIDVVEWEDDDAEDEAGAENGEDEGDGEDGEEDEPLQIDLENFEERMIPIPVPSGAFTWLAVNDGGQLLYIRRAADGSASLQLVDIADEDEMEKTVLAGIGAFTVSADGTKVLALSRGGALAIVDAAPDQSMSSPLSTAGMNARIEPRAEWRQMLRDAWRLQRDYFYAENMHGVDWDAVWETYEPMLDDCSSRADLNYIIGEMIGELNVGHAYVMGGDRESAPSVSVGMLGCDFELDRGAYRIARILTGAAWDPEARGPLSQPGVDVKVGDYLLAVDGVSIDTSKDPWAAFQGLAGHAVTITVSEKPELDEDAREVAVEPMGSSGEARLRHRAWIEENRRIVEEASGGRVGYIYVPDTSTRGITELVRQFVGQRRLEALIVDERWNGGGQSPERYVELLDRPLLSYWARRHRAKGDPMPAMAHYGPKCMLINEFAGSGGDSFPFIFRARGVGPLIGTRTWGGLVGLSGNPGLIDGGTVTVPQHAFYDVDGTWGIEGHGVDPDIEVFYDPTEGARGVDTQLERAVEVMLEELREHAWQPAPRPPDPDRSGMGIREEDK